MNDPEKIEEYDAIAISYNPRLKTVEEWLNHLSELGLSVYGPNMDAETGQEYPACMDYNAEEIVQRRKHMYDGTMWRDLNYG